VVQAVATVESWAAGVAVVRVGVATIAIGAADVVGCWSG
jgi:hypothetical protein